MSDIAITVRGLSKVYQIEHNLRKATSIPDALVATLKSLIDKPLRETFWALKDISFDICRGDVVGVVGNNGAGKSTLLKVMSRITEPTEGRIEIHGRIGSLLEVGTGFHPELTGRENVYLNGSILGMTRREISSKFDEIVDFAGVERFLDTPVKRYSSGMYVRLAFSVAAHLSSEILVVDEVLAVGDAEFQRKCIGKMHDVAQDGRTVLMVSHNIGAIRSLCQSAVYLRQGRLVLSGDVETVIDTYVGDRAEGSTFSGVTSVHGLSLLKVELQHKSTKLSTNTLTMGEDYELILEFDTQQLLDAVGVVVDVRDRYGSLVSLLATVQEGLGYIDLNGGKRVVFDVPTLQLMPGEYVIGVTGWKIHSNTRYIEAANTLLFAVEARSFNGSPVQYHRECGIVRLSSSAHVAPL